MFLKLKEILNRRAISRWAAANPDWASLPFLFLALLVVVGITSETDWNNRSASSSLKKFSPITPELPKDKKGTLPNLLDDDHSERAYVLQNPEQLVSDAFKIPDSQAKQAGFYFDILTKYGENELIIFNANDPSLIYDISSIEDIISSEKSPEEKNKLIGYRAKARIQKILSSINMLRSGAPADSLAEAEQILQKQLSHWKKSYSHALKVSDQGLAFAVGQKNRFKQMIGNRKYELDVIQSVLVSHGIPWEFSRLFLLPRLTEWSLIAEPSIALNLREKHGQKYLIKTNEINEFRSPIKSARVMAKLLKNNPQYSLKKIIKFNGNIQAAFLAALHAERYLQASMQANPSEATAQYRKFRAVKLKRAANWKLIVASAGANEAILRTFNPDLSNKIYQGDLSLPKGFVLFIPSNESSVAENGL